MMVQQQALNRSQGKEPMIPHYKQSIPLVPLVFPPMTDAQPEKQTVCGPVA